MNLKQQKINIHHMNILDKFGEDKKEEKNLCTKIEKKIKII